LKLWSWLGLCNAANLEVEATGQIFEVHFSFEKLTGAGTGKLGQMI
jgi:hypothetical protein